MKVVLLATVTTIMDFDASHIGDDEYKDIASQKCKPLLFWLFLAIQDNAFVQPIQSEGCGSVKVVKEFEKTTMDCLNGGTSDNSGVTILIQGIMKVQINGIVTIGWVEDELVNRRSYRSNSIL